MPAGVDVLVDGPYARISFPDRTKKGPALAALIATGAPIEVRTGGLRREYIVPEGNAREAGLLDEPVASEADDADNDPGAGTDKSASTSENSEVKADDEPDKTEDKEPAKKAAPAKKAPAKKAAPAAKKEDGDA